MIIYPTMELQNGKCVTLHRGRLEEPSIYHVDPVETAIGWAAEGAEWVHVTDFDAVAGTGNNDELIEEIIRRTATSVQLAGGFRTRERVEQWIDKGAGRIALGTMPARDPETFKVLARDFPDQIVLAVDIWQGQLMTDGWKQPAAIQPEVFLQQFSNDPLAAVMITDIDSDIDQPDESLGVISSLAGQTPHRVIASGSVREIDDIARLKYVPNIDGTLVGRALFSRDVNLAEALEIAKPKPEKTADFI
ncbi:1-(5-phosphoribosyl)-5-[(5-phosphoribosylamino)methylideneamino] imidazole-4-carboxamide isomerase [Alisedimentitalea sp. MJ-SS2]|uniref:1-(5-phosphoribosyl)-5-[(5- phosphoribosylamino)methylideneamino]imidazole-4- carboxamide isomerase n=1 Tax=Aliisedimentitalea sp. MJ-SS2 TaxID=3049795 RepID=UPI00290FE6A7|nr:1-(5-phosphoribosyl)-5-[(5-phosphoribosylamino)methylideneamino] imidazole-4-carboxamide isomerase [Alisedimentitalea sp. MJ-SS2]MDU8929142.1 1-(5-phosphoribosyl)-5-[(5-phosphoribosylamino)methylideneamino] imidazole-4-carboxamide isomerase [Alisedimentitalea sp. MJ-SS2]